MSGTTTIEWTDRTWNPVTGCSRISAGCRNCYAEKIAERFRGSKAFPNGFDVTFHPGRLRDPYGWKRPSRVFVNSMSDLFHESVPFDFVLEVWNTMSAAHWHTFQVLTKRASRMLDFFEWCKEGMRKRGLEGWERGVYAMPSIHLGVSVEDQRTADERIPLLLQTPAAVRFLSCEPLLGPVDLSRIEWPHVAYFRQAAICGALPDPKEADDYVHAVKQMGIHWVIAGGESGPGARPMHPDWARSLRDQCQAAGVPFFFKQWGEWAPGENVPHLRKLPTKHLFNGHWEDCSDDWATEADHGPLLYRCGKKAASRLLDGREWSEFPGGAA